MLYTLYSVGMLIDTIKGKGATNLHLTAGALPAVRIDGKLEYISDFRVARPDDIENIVNDMLDDKQKKELKERHYICATVVIKKCGRVRANVFQQRNSYAINIKLLDNVLKTPEELEIPSVVIDLHKKNQGLILVCGNKYSKKSTTVTSIIKKISTSRECQIITIENPIEYLFKHDKAIVNQKEVGIDVNSFEEGVLSAMNQDADVIMTSYASDAQLFSLILSAAESGHLVIASLQTSDTISTIEYILGMFPAGKKDHIRIMLSNVLEAIISQQLIPGADGLPNRLAAEVMIANKAMKNLILENKIHQIPTLIRASRSFGMITMEDSIKALQAEGNI